MCAWGFRLSPQAGPFPALLQGLGLDRLEARAQQVPLPGTPVLSGGGGPEYPTAKLPRIGPASPLPQSWVSPHAHTVSPFTPNCVTPTAGFRYAGEV